MLKRPSRRGIVLALGAAVLPAALLLPSASGATHAASRATTRVSHVLLISVDGLHVSDLQYYIAQNPSSTLAQLVSGGRNFRNAHTTVPSDSFPGLLAQVTGGGPRTTGVYYDAEYNHNLLPAGTKRCAGITPGAAVNFTESLDSDPTALDAGQGLPGLPGSILSMTGQPRTLLNPDLLPVDPTSCKPIYPHQYLRVNTIFEVARQHGLRTAWSDKHPAYEILNGPSGNGVQDLFTPEVNSSASGYAAGDDWTSDNAATQQYDTYKVEAVINEIDGYDHSHSHKVGVPAIFGMNFQTVSTAEKLKASEGMSGGYLPGTYTPGPLLTTALGYINSQMSSIVAELRSQNLLGSTAIILSAKHGQSPENTIDLTRVDDGPIVSAIDAAWKARHPNAPADLVAAATDDDALMMWLSDRSPAAAAFVKQYLLSHTATGTAYDGSARTLASTGLKNVYSGADAAKYFGVPVGDPRHPDVWGVVKQGVVYTSGSKIAEHGGAAFEDRDVPLLVWAPRVVKAGTYSNSVSTTQIAPSILRLLGLDPSALAAVRIEHSGVLPGL